MSRPAMFVTVGIAGYALQTLTLWLLVAVAGMPVVPATVLATEVAILHNFVWHRRWTWADRPAGPRETVARVLRFNAANGAISLVGAVLLTAVLVHQQGLHYLVANLVTVLICATANYVAGDRLVFRRGSGIRRQATGWGRGPGLGSRYRCVRLDLGCGIPRDRAPISGSGGISCSSADASRSGSSPPVA